jgi:putative DNA methylase
VIWASLVDDPSSSPKLFPTLESQARERKRLLELLERLSKWEATSDVSILAEAQKEIDKCFPSGAPAVLDPFGGGGAIPLEGARLGLDVITGDLNPVAVCLQRAALQVPQQFYGLSPINPGSRGGQAWFDGFTGFADDFRHYSSWMIEEAWKSLKNSYSTSSTISPDGKKVVAWIWVRTVVSPDPSWAKVVPLVGSWILVKKGGKPKVWVVPVVDEVEKKISYKIVTSGDVPDPTFKGGKGVCVATGATIDSDYIKSEGVKGRLGQSLIAIAIDGPSGRIYHEANEADLAVANPGASPWVPIGKMAVHPQYMGTPRYGLDEWWKLFTPRQLYSLTTLHDLLPQVKKKILDDYDRPDSDDRGLAIGGNGRQAYAEALVFYLVLALGKFTEMSTSICRWEPIAQCPRTIFARQSISMLMDFAESNPFGGSSGSLKVVVDGIHRVLLSGNIPFVEKGKIEINQRDAATQCENSNNYFVSCDPPYYDNVPYSDLSDFFYVWMKKSLSEIWPDEFSTLLTPKMEELVADYVRFGSKENAKNHFELGLSKVFAAAAKNATKEVPVTIFYAFRATENNDDGVTSTGWETFLNSVIGAGYSISATWPIRTENASRSRAQGANALATSVVLVCRVRSSDAPLATRGQFLEELRSELPKALTILQSENIAPVDLQQAAIGPGIGVFSRYAKILETDGTPMSVRAALGLINEVLADVLSGEDSEFDADTRFAVTWFEQFGHNPGAFGDADTLAKAKNTTVSGVVDSGVAASKDGKLRLLERKELSDKWDPKNDSRLTVWETTQHLIRALEISESKASELLKQIGGGFGEKARQLAYLLYGICDRKKWASEGSAYNMLVTAWPEIEKLAHQEPNGDSSPETLF